MAFYRHQHRPTKLSQQLCADVMGVSVSLWRQWEYGTRTPDVEQWLGIADLLGQPVKRFIGPGAIGVDLAQPAGSAAVKAVRDALYGIGPQSSAVAAAVLAADVAALWGQWQGNAAGRYASVGAQLPALIATAEATVRSLDGDERRAAHRSASTLYQLVWAYARARGAHNWALLAADKSRVHAENADDPESLITATWGSAAMLSTTHDADASYSLLRGAIGRLESGIADASAVEVALIGQMNLLSAVQAVRLRRPDEALAALDVAGRIARLLVERGNPPWTITAFDETNVMIHRATVELERSRYPQAVRLGELVDLTACRSVERRVAHLVHMAHSYRRAGQDMAAVTMLVQAVEDSAEETGSLILARETVHQLARKPRPAYAPQLRRVLETLDMAS
jgi:transcriptional regulator with XRE-family HTH domain